MMEAYNRREGSMRKAAIVAVITWMLCMGVSGAGMPAPEQARCAGTFTILHNPAIVYPEHLRVAVSGAAKNDGVQRIRVSVLVNESLSSQELARYGWRIITRIGEVATLEGPAASVRSLGALPGIRYVKLPSRVYPLMDSVRKVTHADELHKTRPGWTGPPSDR